MDWTEIIIKIPTEYIEKASDIANVAVPYGIYIEDYSDLEEGAREIAHIDLIDEELLSRDRSHGLIHIYINPEDNPAEALDYLSERYTAEGIPNTIETQSCSMEDWTNNWKNYFMPLPIGERLLILPTWRENSVGGDRLVLNIDPGLAFGTGGHNTTRLCLEALERYVRNGDRMLDVGCGSGILSIAGLLLGCEKADGVDIDSLAVKTARENGALNGMTEPRLNIYHGDLVDKISGKYDIIAANIVADVIIRLCATVKNYMKESGLFIVSGIVDVREQDVLDAFGQTGLEVVERLTDGGWVCFVLKMR